MRLKRRTTEAHWSLENDLAAEDDYARCHFCAWTHYGEEASELTALHVLNTGHAVSYCKSVEILTTRVLVGDPEGLKL